MIWQLNLPFNLELTLLVRPPHQKVYCSVITLFKKRQTCLSKAPLSNIAKPDKAKKLLWKSEIVVSANTVTILRSYPDPDMHGGVCCANMNCLLCVVNGKVTKLAAVSATLVVVGDDMSWCYLAPIVEGRDLIWSEAPFSSVGQMQRTALLR